MKKYYLILIIGIALFNISFSEVSASEIIRSAEGGHLDNEENILNSDFPMEWFDNHVNTNALFRSKTEHSITFIEPITIRTILIWFNPEQSGEFSITYDNGSEETLDLKRYENRKYNVVFYENVKKITLTNHSSIYAMSIGEIEFFERDMTLEVDETAPEEITNVDYTAKHNEIALNWNNPTDEDFSTVNIYVDGELVGSTEGNSHTIEGLEENTDYAIRLTTVDETGNESEGVELNVTTETKPLPPPETPEDLPEIRDLKIEADPERVDLSWKNPPQFFEKAKIYRKVTGATTASVLSKLNPFAPIELQASEDFQPLFETNGTTFADLSIEPEESYEYKVTNFYNGMESNGVTVQTSIPKAPLVDTSNIELPFGVGALIESGNGLLLFIGGFVLLALAFIFVPKVVALIKQSFTGGASGKSNGGTVATGARLTERQQKLVTTGGRQPREPRQGRG